MGGKRKRRTPNSESDELKQRAKEISRQIRPTAPSLCARCVAVTGTASGLKSLRSSRGYKHYDLSELSFYSRSCVFCNGLFAQLYQDWKPGNFGRLYLFEKDPSSDWVSTTIEARVTKRTGSGSKGRTDDAIPAATFDITYTTNWNYVTFLYDPSGSQYDKPPGMASAWILESLQEVFQTCKMEHKSCSFQASFLPRRVLDVRPKLDGSIALHVSGKHERHEYIALSYCWGGPQQLTTTRKSLRDRCHGIQMTELPQTILDAVWITRLLGIRYLWVDSLCIIQDDTQDTATEISYMSEVYKGAALTIAAANAPSVRDGFVRLLETNYRRGNFYLDHHNQNKRVCVGFNRKEGTDPLEQRAWTFQESLLSRRLLIFAEGQIRWRCQHQKFVPDVRGSSGSPGSLLRIKDAHSSIRLPSHVFGARKLSARFYGRQQILLWEQLVVDYSKRELTFSHDRLPGIAGVASELAKVWDHVYLAGLWSSCLLNHLGWRPSSGVEADWRTSNYLAPSWSWASVVCGVVFTEIDIPRAQILDCTVQPVVEGALFGQVAKGELVICTIDMGESESPLSELIQNACPFQADPSYPKDIVIYPLLGYTSKRKAVGMIIVGHIDGTYRRRGLWELGLTAEQRKWCEKNAAKLLFRIV